MEAEPEGGALFVLLFAVEKNVCGAPLSQRYQLNHVGLWWRAREGIHGPESGSLL